MNARTAHRTKQRPHRPRGSVLIFAVVFLVILAGLGTAFVMFVIQQSRASANTLHGTEADAVADAGLAHARQVLRQAVGLYRSFSPDAAFDPGKYYDVATPDPPYYRDTYAHAAVIDTKGTPEFAGSDADDVVYGDYVLPGPNGILATTPTAAGDDVFVNQGNVYRIFEARNNETPTDPEIQAGEYALLFWDDGVPYSSALALTDPLRFTEAPLTITSQLNGSGYQAFNDADGAGPVHYGLARRWQLRSPQAGIYNAGAARDLPRVANTRGEYYAWVDNLDGKLFAVPQEWGIDTQNMSAYATPEADVQRGILDNLGLAWDNAERDKMLALAAGTTFVDMGDLVGRIAVATKSLDRANAASPLVYLVARHTLDRYFNIKSDDELKTTATALNLNTAPEELLAAAISQIPLTVDGADPTKHVADAAKALALAKRIVAKRPFLCRVDFEDFLAAHLNADPTAAPDDVTTATATPGGMIWQAMPKRAYPALADLVELPGIAADHPVFRVFFDAAWQRKRFEWFRKDDTLAPVAGALIDAKAFNNLLNSLSGKRRDGTYGYSFYSYDGVAQPFENPVGTVPKFLYTEITAADVTALLKQYRVEGSDASVHTEAAELKEWRATNSSGYYEMTFFACDDTQEVARLGAIPPPPAPPTAIVSGGADGTLQTPEVTDDTVSGTDIIDGGNLVAESFVHAPLRAYRHGKDPATVPAPTAERTSGAAGDGDVAWSPRADFRGRYFMVYILARGIVTISKDPWSGVTTTHYGATRRIEALYDALDDELLWRRNISTELRSLGDPSP
ncbi:MAG: hypothetical protein L6R28_18720 [Planctomycetes bacterium]|nr:hypothetical protein [Planctomycetota bacterium]